LDAWDPTVEKARAVKARYVGVCRGCGAYTQPRNGNGAACGYYKRCHPGAIAPRWTRDRVLAARRDWRGCNGRLLTSYGWSSSHARRRGGEALAHLPEELISLPKPQESASISEVLKGGERNPEPVDLQVLLAAPADFAHSSGR
jgi:hypothetical protein